MIEIVDTYARNGIKWCASCQEVENTKRIRFSYDGYHGISVVLCEDCRRKLYRVLAESEDK